jgi:hypothetical protein
LQSSRKQNIIASKDIDILSLRKRRHMHDIRFGTYIGALLYSTNRHETGVIIYNIVHACLRGAIITNDDLNVRRDLLKYREKKLA